MFRSASAFNQNLCAWGSKLPFDDTLFTRVFQGSGCPTKNEPSFESTPPGPFCYSCTDGPTDGPTQGMYVCKHMHLSCDALRAYSPHIRNQPTCNACMFLTLVLHGLSFGSPLLLFLQVPTYGPTPAPERPTPRPSAQGMYLARVVYYGRLRTNYPDIRNQTTRNACTFLTLFEMLYCTFSPKGLSLTTRDRSQVLRLARWLHQQIVNLYKP
jgi:hypothetical protein